MIKSKHYYSEREFHYQMLISKGRGYLSPKAQHIMILIAKNVIRKKEKSYNSIDDRNDCIQQGLLHMFLNWKNYNHRKYETPGPYFTEIFKRGLAEGLNIITNKKSYNEDRIRTISIDFYNENGRRMDNI